MTNDRSTDEGSHLKQVPWRRIVNVAAVVLVIAISLPLLIHTVPQTVGADQSYVVTSGSMEPAMDPGDIIIVESADPSTIGEGDVITFGARGSTTTHRVINVIQEDGSLAFETKGDNNEDPDPALVRPDDVQGKVMNVGGQLLVIPYIGYVIQFANTQVGFVTLFAVPLVLLVVSEIWNVLSMATTTDGASSAAEAPDTDEDTDSTDADVDSEPVVSDEAGAPDEATAAETTAGQSGGGE